MPSVEDVFSQRLGNTRTYEFAPASAQLALGDDEFYLEASGDATKRLKQDVSAITTATTRTQTQPNCSGLNIVHQLVRTDQAFNLTDDATPQVAFTAANDSLTVIAGMTYRFRALFKITKGTNAVSLNFALTPTTATFTTCNFVSLSTAAASGTAAAAIMNNHEVATTTVIAASSASVNMRIMLDGEFEVNAAGTIAPMLIWSGATGSTPSVNVGSYFETWMTGANPVTIIGAWA